MISVIIPVYNEEPFLERCLDSLANQTDKSAQVIIVDDGSTDGSPKICDHYGEKYGFEVYHLENNGVSAARNFGMEKVKGEYLTFLDADDAYSLNAIEVMNDLAKRGDNVIQFGQYRHTKTQDEPILRAWPQGDYDLDHLRRYWQMVWNKIYKTEFIKKNDFKFIQGMQFGEDEMFNVNVLLKSGGLYHASDLLIHHYFDNTNSLCRGGLCLARLERMDDEENRLLRRLKMGDAPIAQRRWLKRVITRHRHSKVFQDYGFTRGTTAHNDIVYFVKNEPENEELRYSLRSVEKFFPHRNVWFYGGKPDGLLPDRYVPAQQTEDTKWERVRSMLRQACMNDEISENFWLFNDDFFIMKPFDEFAPPTYNGDLYRHIVRVEERHNQQATTWTARLRHLVNTLETAGKGTLNYAVHKPILINRKKALEVLDKFPDEPMFRALYGNYWAIGGTNQGDRKCQVMDFPVEKLKKWATISSDDKSFAGGTVGEYIRSQFPQRSRFEE